MEKRNMDVEAFVDEMVKEREERIRNNAEKPIDDRGYKRIDEITLKFGKGCVGEAFQGKDGRAYREILIPNADENDKRPWQSFVVAANRIHDNKFGKGMWCKLPAEGHTTLKRSVYAGQDENGRSMWDKQYTKVSNRVLKEMVEAYKDKNRVKEASYDKESRRESYADKQCPRESFKDKLAAKKDELSLIPVGNRDTKPLEAAL